jgi:hypothetical protein
MLGYITEIYYLYYVLREINTMRTMNEKSLNYLKGNPKVAEFLNKVNSERAEYYKNMDFKKGKTDLIMEVGNKFLRFWDGSTCWGFISRVDGDLKGAPIKKGDLLKPASWKSPAKHARGNIMDGTARYSAYGPEYL